MRPWMPEDGIMLVTACEQIIKHHQPYDPDQPHFANEAFCKGCTGFRDGLAEYPSASYRVWPGGGPGGFARHQGELITEYVRNSLGCR